MENINYKELRELMLDTDPKSTYYDEKDQLWIATTDWLVGACGVIFESIGSDKCIEDMHEYLLTAADQDDTVGEIITRSGYPDLAKVKNYLKTKKEELKNITEIMKEEKKLNLVELLKNAPEGTKLYTPIYGECELVAVDAITGGVIVKYSNDDDHILDFDARGRYGIEGECLLFPSKDNRDWASFKIEKERFKVGDHIKDKETEREQFNAEEFISNEKTPVETRDGRKVIIYTTKRNDLFSIVGDVDDETEVWRGNGYYLVCGRSQEDLFFSPKKTARRMTNQELSWWLRDHPEEHREWRWQNDNTVHYGHAYADSDADFECKDYILIRSNGGEWKEPLFEEEEDKDDKRD